MLVSASNYQKIKNKYLKFLKSQEVLSEPFRNKISQLNNFYLPISNKINKIYLKDKKTKIIGLTGGQGSGKSNPLVCLEASSTSAGRFNRAIQFHRTSNLRGV